MMKASYHVEEGSNLSIQPVVIKSSKRKYRPLTYITGIAVFSAIIVACYNHVLLGKGKAYQGKAIVAGGTRAGGRELSALVTQYEKQTRGLDISEDERDRIMAVVKTVWPECVQQRMNGIHCKSFIDDEILTLFTGDDRMTRTILVGKRSILDVFYNSVVILMGDDDIVQGRDGDGFVYYDFLWEGMGEEATDEQCAEIPPVIATEVNGDLVIEDEPVLVEGAGCDVPLDGSGDKPVGGGVVIDPKTPNCGPDDDANLQIRIDAAKSLDVPEAGERKVPAFDCTCLSGYACCLLIKATIRDADIWNKAIQCHLNFVPESEKYDKFNIGHGKHVNIYTNHNFVVNINPKVEGTWFEE